MTAPTAWICRTCGTQFSPTSEPPPCCPVCEDERQYVGWDGQRWTRMAELRDGHRLRFQNESGVVTFHLEPGFGIGQRSFWIPAASGNVLWECVSLVTDEAVAEIRALGGVARMAISHPHFYASMVEWSGALGGVPIFLHAEDAAWVQRPSPAITFWHGERLDLSDELALFRLGGHFPGSTALWWRSGPRGTGVLFPGDAIQVGMDRRGASFMFSYPNAIPLGPAAVQAIRHKVAPLAFADVFGFSPGRQIVGGAKSAIEASFDRYLAAIAPPGSPRSPHQEGAPS